MNFGNIVFQLVRRVGRLWRTPQIFATLILLGGVGLMIVVSFFYVPLFLFAVLVIILVGLAIAILYTELNLADTRIENKVVSQRFDAVVENMREGVIIYTPKFRIVRINSAALKMFGLNEKEVVDKTVSPEFVKKDKLKALTQTIFPSLAPVVNQVSKEGWPQIVEITTDNPRLQLTTVLNRLVNEKKETAGFVKIITDRTREEELLRSKTEFITTSAHQLRTPINAISWAFENLFNALEDKPDQKDVADQGLELSKRALKIINDLLDVIKIEEGRYGYTFQEINLGGLMEDIVREARPAAEEYKTQINYSPPLEKYMVVADKERLSAALSVLMDNAIRYNSEGGSVKVVIKNLKAPPAAQVEISDTGIGISEEELPNVFRKFHRGEKAAQFNPNGSGLGLYIAKNIIEKHGGKIWVKSSVGRGSIFFFTLPLKNLTSKT